MRPIDVKLELSDAVRWGAMRNDRIFRAVSGSRSAVGERLSLPAATRAARDAIENVPAYRDAVGPDARRGGRDRSEWFRALPVTDKRSYIDRYSLSDRCVDG